MVQAISISFYFEVSTSIPCQLVKVHYDTFLSFCTCLLAWEGEKAEFLITKQLGNILALLFTSKHKYYFKNTLHLVSPTTDNICAHNRKIRMANIEGIPYIEMKLFYNHLMAL